MKKWYRNNERLAGEMAALLKDIYATFGWITRIAAPLIGRFAYRSLQKEEARLAEGRTYEPVSIYEKNAAALALESVVLARAKAPIQEVTEVSGSPAPVASQSA